LEILSKYQKEFEETGEKKKSPWVKDLKEAFKGKKKVMGGAMKFAKHKEGEFH